MRHTIHTFCSLALLTFAGCAIHVDLPEQFLVTTASSYEFKATTADNAIFWVENHELPEGGSNLEFWVAALKNEFVDNRGYTFLEEEPIVTIDGVKGAQMLYEATTQGRTYRYLTAVFVRPASLFFWSTPVACVARFTAEKAEFGKHVDAVKQAILTTRE
jgi:hypothetical protein